tara:strand:+ start:5900 stop:6547 length:648 start_codon:yes stop_codon:yes gene_type:complete
LSATVAIITGGQGDLATTTASALRNAGYEVHTPGRDALDVLSATSIDQYFKSVKKLDLLINNAGITRDGLFSRQTNDDWTPVIDTHLKGTHLCSQAATRIMIRQRFGHIINVGSFSALTPPAGQTSYAAAKAGIIGLTKSYAKEFGKRNIQVNCVLPGFLDTRMTKDLSQTTRDAALRKHQLGRFTTLEEASRFFCFLASTQHISGQVFQLDSRT